MSDLSDPWVSGPLALRLILAHLADTADETAFLLWAIRDESGMSANDFILTNRVAYEAASWWRGSPESRERGRRRLLTQLERVVPA